LTPALALHRRNLALKRRNFCFRYDPRVLSQRRILPRNRFFQIFYFLTHCCDLLVSTARHGASLLARIVTLCLFIENEPMQPVFLPLSTQAAAPALRPCETIAMTIDWLAELKCDAALGAHG
jgi:hypothetical protein